MASPDRCMESRRTASLRSRWGERGVTTREVAPLLVAVPVRQPTGRGGSAGVGCRLQYEPPAAARCPLALRSARKSALGKSGAVRRAGPRSAAGSRGRRRRASADARRHGGRCRARRGCAQVDASTARPRARGGRAAPTARGGSAGCGRPHRPRGSSVRSTGGDSRVVVGRRTPKAYGDGVRVEGCGGVYAGVAVRESVQSGATPSG